MRFQVDVDKSARRENDGSNVIESTVIRVKVSGRDIKGGDRRDVGLQETIQTDTLKSQFDHIWADLGERIKKALNSDKSIIG